MVFDYSNQDSSGSPFGSSNYNEQTSYSGTYATYIYQHFYEGTEFTFGSNVSLSGAADSTLGSTSNVSIPRTLAVEVVEGLYVNNGDPVQTEATASNYVDVRGTGGAWSNATAVYESDGVYATANLSADQTSEQLFAQDFGFQIPAGSEILGIEVIVERSRASGAVDSDSVGVGICEFPGVVDWSAANEIAIADVLPSNYPSDIVWSPSGEYLAVSIATATVEVWVYKFANGALTRVAIPPNPFTASPTQLSWSPNNEFLAYGSAGSPYIKVWQRAGDVFTAMTLPSLPSSRVNTTAWNSDSNLLACVNASNKLVVWSRIGTTFTLETGISLPPNQSLSVNWNHIDSIMSVGHYTSPYITNYDVVGTGAGATFTKRANPASLPDSDVTEVSWSPDGTILALGLISSPYVVIYSFNGGVLTKIPQLTVTAALVQKISWDSTSTFMTVATTGSQNFDIWERSGVTFTKLVSPPLPVAGVLRGVQTRYAV